MTFEQALKDGDLDVARAILDELVALPDTGGLLMPECYADLAREYDRQGRHDDAIELHQRAVELGWDSIPHPRSDIAEFHLRAGRDDVAAAIWAELKASDPDDVWLYNAAGLSYNEVGQHELAIAWLGEGIELAMRTDDPEGIINQLSDVRRHSLRSLGRELDELEQRVDPFMAEWSSEERAQKRRLARLIEAGNFSLPTPDRERDREREDVVVSLAWFPSGEYEEAIKRWPSLAEDWPTSRTAIIARVSTATSNGCEATACRSGRSRRSSWRTSWRGARSTMKIRRKHEPPTPSISRRTAKSSHGRLGAMSRAGAAPDASTRSAAARHQSVRCMIRSRRPVSDGPRQRTDHCQIAGADRRSRAAQ